MAQRNREGEEWTIGQVVSESRMVRATPLQARAAKRDQEWSPLHPRRDVHSQARQEYGILEKTLCIASTPVDLPATVVAPAAGAALVSLLRALPHGVEKGSHALADLVETSTNLASVRPAEGGAAHEIVTCTRSSLPFALERLRDRIAIVAAALGAEVHQDDAYPGWAPDPSSKVVQIVAEEYAKMAGPGAAAKVGAIHAGLECGIIGERVGKGMDMVSFGPTITGAHSPDERVCVPTVGPFFDLCVAVLGRLADVRA